MLQPAVAASPSVAGRPAASASVAVFRCAPAVAHAAAAPAAAATRAATSRRYRRSAPRVVAAQAAPATQAAAAASGASQLPRSPAAMVDQAAGAVQAALDAGRARQMVSLLLPVNEKEADFNSTEPVDYPCSLQKEFDTACALTKSLLQRLLGAGTNINAKRIDDGGVEGEPCAVLFPDDKSFLAVVFPTADRLKQLQGYAKQEGRPLLIVNPQWRNEGQVISDFGFGPWRKAADDFLATFEPSYALKEKRIGSPGTVDAATGTRFVSGGVIRLLRSYPGPWEAHAMAANGSSQFLENSAAEPGYKDLDAAIKRGRAAKLEIFAIAQQVTAVYRSGSDEEEAADGASSAGAAGAAGATDEEVSGLSDADIEALDAASLRRLLLGMGLPASGKISKLRERLREARNA